MEPKVKLKIVITVATVAAAISLYLSARYRRQRRRKCSPSPCYLHSEPKPQYTFKRVLADNSYSPFKHLKLDNSANDNGSESHPYEADITALLESPRVEFSFVSETLESEMSEGYVWVETEEQLKELADALSKETVFAVDTEQHSLRSFLGFTALVQISTLKEDYLVDTIALHDHIGILRSVFADPGICKVFHGADNDIIWLQRDFHIYVVNLFDTAKACEVLAKPQKSLAYLLETYCAVTTDKSLQREDWRQRPLSEDMVQYARTDAHYLLYIASCLFAELKQRSNEYSSSPDDKFHFVVEASRRSNMMCLQLYTKEIEAFPGESAASSILSRHVNGITSSISTETQFQDLVRRLCAWRDIMARVHDESLRYVLSDQAIIALARKVPSTETEIQGIILHADHSADSTFNSFLPSPSPTVGSHSDGLFYLFQEDVGNQDDIFLVIIQKCLGPSGTCPLSIFNYGLLVNCNLKSTSRLVSKQNGTRSFKQVARKSSRELFVQKFSCKAPVYHNCRIYANDGRLLCYCDRRKLEWYLRRDLAKLTDENPPAIMLLFEPKGRPEDEDNDFYIQSKKNICVGCGEGNHYLRYRIIPSCYRIHFPEHLKSHRSHDIVLLCVDCHEVAHAAAEKYKRQIAAEFGIPLFVRKVVHAGEATVVSGLSDTAQDLEETGVSPLQLRTAAMALLRHGPRMPSARRDELLETVRSYYGGREITAEDLEKALVAGMSPHEKRKFEKKTGLSIKHCGGSILPPRQEDNASGLDGEGLAINNEKSNSQGDKEVPCTKDAIDVDSCGDRDSPEGVVEASNHSKDSDGTAKHNSKMSLLGHGPHGKQVVDHILKEYGEEGIQNFCQRWREVFVQALRPRFLPAGWDVKHSGKREFGEFSVYNPGKKASTATE